MRRRQIVSGILAWGLAGAAWAQTPVPSPTPPTTRLCWDHDGQNIGAAVGGKFTLAVDGGTAADLGVPTPSGQTYCTPFPALTPGSHTLLVCAVNIAGASCAAPFPVSVVVTPNAPAAVRVVTGG